MEQFDRVRHICFYVNAICSADVHYKYVRRRKNNDIELYKSKFNYNSDGGPFYGGEDIEHCGVVVVKT